MKMPRIFLLACLGFMAAAFPAQAQWRVTTSCPGATALQPAGSSGAIALVDVNGNLCISGGGGGGLSVVDQTAFTQGTSAFTPNGGVFNDSATLSSGQEGTVRLTTKRAMVIDTDIAGNALYSAITGPVPTGTNIIGKVGIDQTTPGTTNLVAAIQSGTWILQPGNTANSTPWLVTSASATAPVSTMNSSSANGGLNAALAGAFDDASPTSITENNFGFLRMSANRNLYGTIRDGAGSERGAAVAAANTAPTTSDAGLVTNINCSYTGAPCITLGGATAANSVPTVSAGYSFSHISTATTTTVKSGAGVLHTLTVNNLGTVASTTTVYDNTAGSGTVMAVINTLAGQTSYIYDISFATGLTAVTTGTVAPDVTISYR